MEDLVGVKEAWMADAWASATSTHALCPRRLYEQKKKKSAKWVGPVPVARRPKCTVALCLFPFLFKFSAFLFICFVFYLLSILFRSYNIRDLAHN